MVVAVAVAAGAVLPAEGGLGGPVDASVGVGKAVFAECFEDAAFGIEPAGLEFAAQRGGAGVLPVAGGAVGPFGVGGVEVAGEDAGRVRVGGEGAVDAFEGLELLHQAFASEVVATLAVELDAGGGVGDVDGVELEVGVRVVHDGGEQPFGPWEHPAGGVDGGEGPAAGDEEAVLAEGSGVGEAVLAGELEGVGDVHAVAFEGAAPGGGGVAADLLRGDEVGGEVVESCGEHGVEAAASVGDVEGQDPGHGVSLRVLVFTLGDERDVR
jgi:hypothetical protein